MPATCTYMSKAMTRTALYRTQPNTEHNRMNKLVLVGDIRQIGDRVTDLHWEWKLGSCCEGLSSLEKGGGLVTDI